MLILTLRTDSPEAEIGVYEDDKQLAYQTWQAHRELAATLHRRIDELLTTQGKTLQDIQGIVCFQGPGSFTGLRIGLTVANTLAYSLKIPIVGDMDDDWITQGVKRLQKGDQDTIVMPEYGAPVHITQPKK